MIVGISGRMGSGKDTLARMIQFATLPVQVKRLTDNWESPARLLGERIIQTKRFADPVKDIVCMLIGCTREQLEDREFKESNLGAEWAQPLIQLFSALPEYRLARHGEKPDRSEPITVRKLMQLIGTDAMREVVHPDVWVNAMFSQYRNVRPSFVKGDYFGKCQECGNTMTYVDKRQSFCEWCSIKPLYPNWIIPDVRFPNEAKRIKSLGGFLIRVNRPWKPKISETIDIKVFSNWSTVQYSHTEDDQHHGVGSDGYKYRSTLIRQHNPHPSETALDTYEGFDVVIENTGTLEDLYQNAVNIVKQLNLRNDESIHPKRDSDANHGAANH